MSITKDHLHLAKVLIENACPEEAVELLLAAKIPFEDKDELKDVLTAKLLHIKKQKPYVKAGKPLFKALDEIAGHLKAYDSNVRNPLFVADDREALIKALKASPQWERFDVKRRVAFVTKKSVKENVVGRQDLVLTILFDKKPTKPFVQVVLGHLEAMDGKLLTFGHNYFYDSPEKYEPKDRPFSWKLSYTHDIEPQFGDATLYIGLGLVADHATSDFKGSVSDLVQDVKKNIMQEAKKLKSTWDKEVGTEEKPNLNEFVKDSLFVMVDIHEDDKKRLHPQDQRLIKDLEKDNKFHIEVKTL